MSTYIIRRLLLIIPTLILVTIIVFLSVRFIPGSIIDLMTAQIGDISDVELARQQIREALGLDEAIHIQYIKWFGGVLTGDLGESLWTGREITKDILSRLPISLELGILAIITSMLISIPIGIYSAVRQDTMGDYVGRSFAIMCISLPSFWLGTMVMVFPAVWWGWSPSAQYVPITENLGSNIVQFIIPAVIMGMVMSGTTMRMTRTMMLEVLRQDYIKTAWSKGMKERNVVLRHALKNALIPVVTIIGLQVPILIGGSVIMERIFNLPGIGRLLLDALGQRDYPVISGVNIVMATAVLFINLTVDVFYAYLDPRISYH